MTSSHKRGRIPKEEQATYEKKVQEMHDLHVAGLPLAGLARRYGYHASSVVAAFEKRNLEIYYWPRTLTPESLELLESMAADGSSKRETAQRLGVTPRTIKQWADLLEIEFTWKPERTHGLSGYNRGCRCDICRTTHNARMRERYREMRANGKPKTHGISGYMFYGCKCDVCKEAGRLANQRAAERRRTRLA